MAAPRGGCPYPSLIDDCAFYTSIGRPTLAVAVTAPPGAGGKQVNLTDNSQKQAQTVRENEARTARAISPAYTRRISGSFTGRGYELMHL